MWWVEDLKKMRKKFSKFSKLSFAFSSTSDACLVTLFQAVEIVAVSFATAEEKLRALFLLSVVVESERKIVNSFRSKNV